MVAQTPGNSNCSKSSKTKDSVLYILICLKTVLNLNYSVNISSSNFSLKNIKKLYFSMSVFLGLVIILYYMKIEELKEKERKESFYLFSTFIVRCLVCWSSLIESFLIYDKVWYYFLCLFSSSISILSFSFFIFIRNITNTI